MNFICSILIAIGIFIGGMVLESFIGLISKIKNFFKKPNPLV